MCVCAEKELLCRSVWSERSGLSAGDRAAARCRYGEEMMGCTSYAPEGGRMGETISVSSRGDRRHKHNLFSFKRFARDQFWHHGRGLKYTCVCVCRSREGTGSAWPITGAKGRTPSPAAVCWTVCSARSTPAPSPGRTHRVSAPITT